MNDFKLKYSNSTILPNNILAEQAILNILLTNPSTSLIQEVLLNLKIESFYFEPHKLIYETISELSEKNLSINLANVLNNLQDKSLLKKIGGVERLFLILNRFENVSDLDAYISSVNEKYLRRLIIEIGKKAIVWGYTTSESLEVILEKLERSLFLLNQEKNSQKIYTAAEVIDDVFEEIKQKIKNSSPTGLLTGFKDLDSILQGFQKSDLIIIAGRPSMGKTAFSLNLAKNVVATSKAPLIIFTLEMSRQQIIYRFLSTDSEINANRLKSGKMTAKEWKALGKSMKEFSELPIFIDDNANLTVSDIRSKLKKIFPIKGKEGGLIIIDYLQLMKLNFKLENRVQEISYITRNLKILSKEFEIPIILLSQLSRAVESRTNKRPMLSDLRESGCLAQISSNLKIKSRLETFEINSKIEKVEKKEFLSWNKKKLITNNSQNFEFKGSKPTFLLTFDNNITICLTSNHKILSKKGWISISQIQPKTEIYCLLKKNKKLLYSYKKVTSILYCGVKDVYDQTISKFHNYLNDGFVLHNSIEQDADIVIMLYREDYYNEKSSAESQLTEFIVAKHRNGPIGTAKLLFQPAIASFKSL
jgi:replicative DNA helicase